MTPILIIPGFRNPGEGHWLTLWGGSLPDVHQIDWPGGGSPILGEWVEALDEAIADCAAPPLLVGHALGCLAIVHWAAEHAREVQGALLAAPADVAAPDAPALWRPFAPIPRHTLAFPSLVAASSNDPHLRLERARALAADWGANFVDLGPCGHLDQASGHGPWPRGEALLAELR